MPVNKKTLNKGKKVAKKVKKSKHKGLIFLLFLIVVGIVGFLGYEYIQEKNNYGQFEAKVEEIKDKIAVPNSLDDNLVLQDELDGYRISWSSSNEELLSKTGVVKRPSYSQGDSTIKLTGSIKYEKKTFLYGFIKSSLGEEEFTFSYNITILAIGPTPEDYIDMAIKGIYVPSEVDSSIGLPSSAIVDGLTITWTSNNHEVMNDYGSVIYPLEDTLVTMTANVNYEGVSKSQEYDVLVMSSGRKKYVLEENFDELTESNRYSDFESGNISYKNALICVNPTFDETTIDYAETNSSDNALKLRSNNEKTAYFETKKLYDIFEFTFEYQFNASVGENTYFELYLNDALIEKIIPEKKEEFVKYTYDFENEEGVIKFVFVNNIKSEKVMIIDNIYARTYHSDDDLDGLIKLPSSITKSYVLPYSTNLGGVITWSSSNESIISNAGIINKNLQENTKVSLTAHLKYRSLEKTYVFEVDIVLNKTAKDALNIYFIDICEEDIGDCGEAILIVYNDMDILVDAGDQKSSTYNCVRNAIIEYSSDQVLDYVIATHPDSDHIGNMANVFNDFQVNNLVKFSGESFTTQKFKNLKAAYDAEPNCHIFDIYNDIINDNDKENNYIRLSDAIYIEFLDTKHYLDSETNGRSIVFLLTVYETKVLFTGDADNLSPHSNLEASYMNEVGDIDILKVVHHGTANGTSKEYLDVLKPEVAIICNGNYLGNKHGHPHVSTIDRLSSCSSIEHVYAITGGGLHCEMTSSGAYKGTTTLEESKIERNGTITIVIDDNGYTISAKITGENLIDLRNTTYYKSYLASK